MSNELFCLLCNSLHWQSSELHGGLVEQVVVSVAIEHEFVVVDTISHQLDVNAILLEEISCLKSLCLFEGTIIWAS